MVKMDHHLFRRKCLLVCLGKLGEVLKQQQIKGYNNLTITLSTFFVTFCFFQPESCFPWQAMVKTISAHFGHYIGLNHAEL